jgi:hypothetical protein
MNINRADVFNKKANYRKKPEAVFYSIFRKRPDSIFKYNYQV